MLEPINRVLESKVIKTASGIEMKVFEIPQIEPIQDESEFSRLRKPESFRNWVMANYDRILAIPPKSELFDTIVAKWDGFFPGENLLLLEVKDGEQDKD
jgi:hypothetical protein